RHDRGVTAVSLGMHLRVIACFAAELPLLLGRGSVRPVLRSSFGIGLDRPTTARANEAHAPATVCREFGCGTTIHIVYAMASNVRDGLVVLQSTAGPSSAVIALTVITRAIVDAAVEAHLRCPVAFLKGVLAVTVAPVAWRPEEVRTRRHDPCAWHPV